MTRSKDHALPNHHDKHVTRHGHSESVKKMGAGVANWGVLGDEIPDVEEFAHADQTISTTTKADKVNLVDSKTFESLRQ